MLKALVILALNGSGLFATAHEGRTYDASQPVVEYRNGRSRHARNWWDRRPVGQLFEADEGGGRLPGVVAKGL